MCLWWEITKGKRQLGRPRRKWNDTVKMDHEKMGWEGVEWINPYPANVENMVSS